jgi:apolipoprotein N-acyltransferase
MFAVAAWGATLALGTTLFGYDQATGEVHYAPNPLRGLIVLTFVTVFLAGWGALLLAKR